MTGWYAEREGGQVVNHGVSIGHIYAAEFLGPLTGSSDCSHETGATVEDLNRSVLILMCDIIEGTNSSEPCLRANIPETVVTDREEALLLEATEEAAVR